MLGRPWKHPDAIYQTRCLSEMEIDCASSLIPTDGDSSVVFGHEELHTTPLSAYKTSWADDRVVFSESLNSLVQIPIDGCWRIDFLSSLSGSINWQGFLVAPSVGEPQNVGFCPESHAESARCDGDEVSRTVGAYREYLPDFTTLGESDSPPLECC